MRIPTLLLLALALGVPATFLGSDGRSGNLFDPGVSMEKRAPGARAEPDAMAYILGDWVVSLVLTSPDGETHETAGVAAITFMNR